MNDEQIHAAARALGSRGGKAPKTITPADRERRRVWAKGLAKLRLAKAQTPPPYTRLTSRFIVIDRQGARWPYHAENAAHAITLARHDGIDAIGAKVEKGE